MSRSCENTCSHGAGTTALCQTIDELEFERGIWTAALDADMDRLQMLITKDPANVNKVDTNGYTALHYAARAGHTDVCTVLLEHGASVNARLRSGDTALHRASYMGRDGVVTLLINYKAECCRGADGQTALHKAVQQKHLTVAQLLAKEYPLHLNTADSLGRLPKDLFKYDGVSDTDWQILLKVS
ncbi:ankyrin repeat domain-containing protein 39-like [Watersipora subatra]|uniref:ankyrin repeat domain-containing protein 39-like n=1 Tax=Watersipora subatra TaxID=2589382 RepID=UPI00355C6443